MADQPENMIAPANPPAPPTAKAPQPIGTSPPANNPFRTGGLADSKAPPAPYVPNPPAPAPSPYTPTGGLGKYAPTAGSVGTTADPAAATREKAMKMTTNPLSVLTNPIGAAQSALTGLGDKIQAEAATPPLSKYTNNLGSFKGVADSFLGAAKGFLENHPDRTASVAGALAPSLVEGLGNFSLPALLGVHGMLSGGESGMATKAYFDPLLSKLGLS